MFSSVASSVIRKMMFGRLVARAACGRTCGRPDASNAGTSNTARASASPAAMRGARIPAVLPAAAARSCAKLVKLFLVLAQVRLADLLVVAQRLGLVGEHDVARLHDVAAVRSLQRHQRVLLDEQDGGSLRIDLADDLEDLVHEDRRQPERRLVE